MRKKSLAFTTVFCLVALLLCVACSSSTTTVDYSDDSLIAYHENLGNDISSLTEVSVESCGECHGDRSAIRASTEGILEAGATVANPHLNHMTKEIECSDCHSLAEASTLYCRQCHTYTMTRDNGTWDTD
jgi:Zn finger protein HypA/HybF involved in hydrogenase expression